MPAQSGSREEAPITFLSCKNPETVFRLGSACPKSMFVPQRVRAETVSEDSQVKTCRNRHCRSTATSIIVELSRY